MVKKMDFVLSCIDGSKGASEGTKPATKLKTLQATQQGKRDGGDTPAEEEQSNRSTVQFINPSADLFENPFRRTMDEVEGKIKFVKHFIATDALYQVMTNVNEHIKAVETRRYNEWVEQKLAALTRAQQQQQNEIAPDLRLETERKPEDQPRSAVITNAGNNSRTPQSRKNLPSTGSGSAKSKKKPQK